MQHWAACTAACRFFFSSFCSVPFPFPSLPFLSLVSGSTVFFISSFSSPLFSLFHLFLSCPSFPLPFSLLSPLVRLRLFFSSLSSILPTLCFSRPNALVVPPSARLRRLLGARRLLRALFHRPFSGSFSSRFQPTRQFISYQSTDYDEPTNTLSSSPKGGPKQSAHCSASTVGAKAVSTPSPRGPGRQVPVQAQSCVVILVFLCLAVCRLSFASVLCRFSFLITTSPTNTARAHCLTGRLLDVVLDHSTAALEHTELVSTFFCSFFALSSRFPFPASCLGHRLVPSWGICVARGWIRQAKALLRSYRSFLPYLVHIGIAVTVSPVSIAITTPLHYPLSPASVPIRAPCRPALCTSCAIAFSCGSLCLFRERSVISFRCSYVVRSFFPSVVFPSLVLPPSFCLVVVTSPVRAYRSFPSPLPQSTIHSRPSSLPYLSLPLVCCASALARNPTLSGSGLLSLRFLVLSRGTIRPAEPLDAWPPKPSKNLARAQAPTLPPAR